MSIRMTDAEALFALLRLAALSGAIPSARESTDYWSSRLMSLKRFATMDIDEVSELTRKVANLVADNPREALLAAIAEALSPQARLAAFSLATDVILADAVLELPEREALTRIQAALDIPDDTAEKITEVMLIKNSF